MKKKNKNNKKEDCSFEDIIQSVVGPMDDDQLNAMIDIFSNMTEEKSQQILNDTYYTYQRPDYAAQCHPVELHLNRLYNATTLEEVVLLCPDAIEVMQRQEQQAREQSVRNMLLCVLADAAGDDEQMREMAMLGALWLMEHFDMTNLADILLELLRQEARFTDYMVEGNDSLLSMVISKICRDRLPLLADFVREKGLLPNGQYLVADAVIEMAVSNPSRRYEVIEWMNSLLNYLAQPETDPAPTNIDHIAFSLMQLKAVETVNALQKCYKAWVVPELEMEGGRKRLMDKMMEGTTEHRVMWHTVQDYLNMFIINKDLYEEEQEEDDDDTENTISLFVPRHYPVKRLKVRVTLDDAPLEISRELTIPSNLRLTHFSEVLIRAMGWNRSHLDIFSKGKARYCDPYTFDQWKDDGMENIYCYDDLAVGELLQRKGSKLTWEYDLGDSWRHTIQVMEAETWGMSPYTVTLDKARGACPPDDCGGVWGYADLIKIMADPTHPEYATWEEWLGGKLEPHKSNISKARKAIKEYINPTHKGDDTLPF